jgi:hypothetical protein
MRGVEIGRVCCSTTRFIVCWVMTGGSHGNEPLERPGDGIIELTPFCTFRPASIRRKTSTCWYRIRMGAWSRSYRSASDEQKSEADEKLHLGSHTAGGGVCTHLYSIHSA